MTFSQVLDEMFFFDDNAFERLSTGARLCYSGILKWVDFMLLLYKLCLFFFIKYKNTIYSMCVCFEPNVLMDNAMAIWLLI